MTVLYRLSQFMFELAVQDSKKLALRHETDPEFLDLTGLGISELNRRAWIAEAGVCEFLEIPWLGPHPGRDDGADCFLPNGHRAQIKQRKFFPAERGLLYFKKGWPENCQLAILVQTPDPALCLSDDWIDILGWVTHTEWLQNASLADLGRGIGPQKVLRQAALHPIQALARRRAALADWM